LPLLPGVMTPSDILSGLAEGYDTFKFFPAQQAGGMAMLKAFHGPFPDLLFCPTGGIDVSTAPQFLALPNVACVGGSWLAPKAAVQARDWPAITRLAAETQALRRS
jgi:2-dehydro-3-deoxyphosphogluconate aldolase / (4S)-4-hydroxy-2-oxoglutarate aldolase